MKKPLPLLILILIALSLTSCEKNKSDSPTAEVILEEFYADVPGEWVSINVSGNNRRCKKVGDLYIYQGDMVFKAGEPVLKGTGVNYRGLYWPCRTVYYDFEEGFPWEKKVIKAIEQFHKFTDIKFVLRTNQANYVHIIKDDGCASMVGMIGGQQKLWLAEWASVGTVVHELCHAIGVEHEQSKPTRDKYIIVHEENIISGKENNFEKMQLAVFTEGFDFNSIMLYPSKAFSKNGENTITKIDGSTYTAQRDLLSLNDLETIEAMYSVVDKDCIPKETDELTDLDGNSYTTVKIGEQWWMAENLAVTHLRDGTPISNITHEYDWWDNTTKPAYSWYDNDEAANKEVYGALYNWAVVKTNLLCPAGWHVSTDDDWKEMEIFLGMSETEANQSGGRGEGVGGKLKIEGTEYWYITNEGASNESGFSALPGGKRDPLDGWSNEKGVTGYWWSPGKENGSDKPQYRQLYDLYTKVYRYTAKENSGFSVRCVKDR